MTDLQQFHAKFPGGARWRTAITSVPPGAIEIEGQGIVPASAAAISRAAGFVEKYREFYATASAAYCVPVELLIACSLTEAGTEKKPETCVRREPGYRSVEETPGRISAGMCQMLVSTARQVMGMKSIDLAWLFVPANAISACAAYIKAHQKITGFDPIYVACDYNAGGLYENKGEKNRWRLRQYPIGTGHHADRFAEYFVAALQLTLSHHLSAEPYLTFASYLLDSAAAAV